MYITYTICSISLLNHLSMLIFSAIEQLFLIMFILLKTPKVCLRMMSIFRGCLLFTAVECILYSVLYSILWLVLYSVVCPKLEKKSVLYSLAYQALKRLDAVVKPLCLDYENQSRLVLVSSSKP